MRERETKITTPNPSPELKKDIIGSVAWAPLVMDEIAQSRGSINKNI
jgi:hypothetical protein